MLVVHLNNDKWHCTRFEISTQRMQQTNDDTQTHQEIEHEIQHVMRDSCTQDPAEQIVCRAAQTTQQAYTRYDETACDVLNISFCA
jgi:hypothetical protein